MTLASIADQLASLAVGHWNDILTVLTAGAALYTVFDRRRESKRKRGRPVINDVREPTYQPRFGATRKDHSRERDGTKFRMKLDLQNKGREPISVVGVKIESPELETPVSPALSGSLQLEETERKITGVYTGLSDENFGERPDGIESEVTIDTSHGKASAEAICKPKGFDKEPAGPGEYDRF